MAGDIRRTSQEPPSHSHHSPSTKPEGENWRRPEEKDADTWVEFLDSLNWVIKKRLHRSLQ